MKVLFSTSSAASYMQPPLLGDEQVNCGPDWADERAPDGRIRSLATPAGEYDLAAVAAKLPPAQAPDLVVCLVDSSWRNVPRNLGSFSCPRVLLIADTHHLRSPLLGMLRYLATESFDRIVFLYDRHHAGFFHAAGFRNLFWFPGLTFPHADAAVRRARKQSARAPRIAFVGQAGRHHPRRARLLSALTEHQLPVVQQALPQNAALDFYGSSLLGFNASLNGDLNLRVFEIIAAGGTLLTDRLAPESGLAQLFPGDTGLLAYGSPDELVERATAALADPAGTAAMGAASAKWFDRHLSAARRRAAFRSLAFDGTAVPEFAFTATETTRVFFGGDTDRLLQGLLVYEQVQEKHRTQETVWVQRAAAIAGDVDALFTTLPRISAGAVSGDTPPDLAVFNRSAEAITPAQGLWCIDAQEGDAAVLATRFASQGYVWPDQSVALFSRGVAPVPAKRPTTTSSRVEGLLLVARVALQAGDQELCQEMMTAARQAGAPEAELIALTNQLEQKAGQLWVAGV